MASPLLRGGTQGGDTIAPLENESPLIHFLKQRMWLNPTPGHRKQKQKNTHKI